MTKADLVKQVANDTGMLRREVAQIVDAFLLSVKEKMKELSQSTDEEDKKKSIEIRGFGTFRLKTRKPRVGRNPKTEEKVPVPERVVPTFKFSREFKLEIINSNEE